MVVEVILEVLLGTAYFVINNDLDSIKLAASYNDALSSTSINLTTGSSGA